MRKGNFRRALWTTSAIIAVAIALFGSAFAQNAEQTNTRLQERITLDADDAYLPTVLAVLAEKSGYNIVTGPGVSKTEKLTVKLKDVPIEEAMNIVVRAVGLSYEKVGNSFLVAQPEFVKNDVGLSSTVMSLQYADPRAVKSMLAMTKATVEIDSGTGKLLITASPKVMAEIRGLVSEIDTPALQIMLSTRVIEVAIDDEEKIGVDWSRLSPIRMQVAEGGASSLKLDRFDNFGVFYRQQPIFDFALDWLLKNNKAQMLANSQVATQNGKAAELKVVDVFPYLYSTTQQQFNPQQTNAITTAPTVTLEKEEVGIKLKIIPKVNNDGNITTTVDYEVSSIFQFIGRNLDIPWVSKRTASTTIRAKDGEPIIIGGLLGVTRKNLKHKVPFLGDIPYFGDLFRHSSVTISKSDMIIEVTPTILKDGVKFQSSKRIADADVELNKIGAESGFPKGNEGK